MCKHLCLSNKPSNLHEADKSYQGAHLPALQEKEWRNSKNTKRGGQGLEEIPTALPSALCTAAANFSHFKDKDFPSSNHRKRCHCYHRANSLCFVNKTHMRENPKSVLKTNQPGGEMWQSAFHYRAVLRAYLWL